MQTVREALLRALGHLGQLDHAFAIVGGLAVSARCEPRLTRDVDIAMAVSGDDDAEEVVLRLQRLGYRVVTTLEQDVTRRLATVRLQSSEVEDAGALLDLLFASSGIEAEIAARAEPIEILSGISAPVAQPGHLIALKILARDDRLRPQDAMDLRSLLRDASAADLALAREALALIHARGFHRGRDLSAALAQASRDFR
jgi:predicted nucleotidyltransferase